MHFFGPYKSKPYEIAWLLFLPFATTSSGRGAVKRRNQGGAANEFLSTGFIDELKIAEEFKKTIIGKATMLGYLCLVLTNLATAAEVPYTKARFDKQLADGQAVVVYLHATWCPTCKIQQPIVDRLSSEAEFKSMTVFEADYDSETALKKSLRITQQSTFVVFKGGHEVTRSTGETTEPSIRKTFEAGM